MSHRLIRRLSAVRNEFEAARSSLALTARQWPVLHREIEVVGQRFESFLLAAENLEGTYVVRLFAEFEAALREQYPHSRPRRVVPITSFHLITSFQSRYGIPVAFVDEVHLVRQYRHSIAHARGGAQVVTFAGALSCLNRYLSWIPDADVPV